MPGVPARRRRPRARPRPRRPDPAAQRARRHPGPGRRAPRSPPAAAASCSSREHGGGLPGQPDHRPPRRAAPGAAQHRLAAAGLDAARRCTPYGLGDTWLAGAQVVAVALGARRPPPLAQVAGLERRGVRRREHGVLIVRALGVGGRGASPLWLQLTGQLAAVLDRLPTTHVVLGMIAAREGQLAPLGPDGPGAAGGHPASPSCWAPSPPTWPRGRPRATRSGSRPARGRRGRTPRSDLAGAGAHRPRRRCGARCRCGAACSCWPSVPAWSRWPATSSGARMTILPGLVASGGALLFGVNAWCLDGRGALWRESLPVDAGHGVRRPGDRAHRVAAGGLRAHRSCSPRCGPACRRPHELTALLCTWLVVTVQVVGAVAALVGPAARSRSTCARPGPPRRRRC